MNKRMMRGIIAGGIVGATIGIYAINNMNPRERRKMMRNKKNMLNNTMSMMKGFNMF